MSFAQLTRKVSIVNPEGLHCRFAVMILEVVRRFDASVVLCKDNTRAQATDVLHILSLGAAQGDELTLEATGPQAAEVLEALVQLIRNYSQDDGTAGG